MVAYSFRTQFEGPIVRREKRQTVRGFRKRHARPGEALQLFTGMRTRQCRKILLPDPTCVEVQEITLAFDAGGGIVAIELDGRSLSVSEIERFAADDGFGADGSAARRMGEFWLREHGGHDFTGVVIRWDPGASA